MKETKKSFPKLKKVFYEEPVLEYFDISKLIIIELSVFEKGIGGVLYQQDTDNNWHPVAYYLYKIVLAERNYKTHDTQLLAIVESFRM